MNLEEKGPALKVDAFYQELGRRVGQRRREANLTQDDLARSIGLKRTSITNLEKGKQKLLAHSLVEIADKLKVDVAELLPDGKSRATRISNLQPDTLEVILKAVPDLKLSGRP